MPFYVPGGGNALPGLQYPIIAQPTRPLAGPRKRSAVGRDIRLHALFITGGGWPGKHRELLLGGRWRSVLFILRDTVLNGFGFARRFRRKLIGVADGVVFDLTRLFDDAVTFLLCVLLHRIGLGFRLLGDGIRFLVRLRLDGAGLILQAIGLGVGLAFQRINLLIRILLNRLGFVRRGILHLLRIIFGLIQFVIYFRRIVAAKQGQA